MSNNIVEKNICELTEEYMKKYGKKVIEDRAIPALIDGLKPVQRRVLYSMYENKQISDMKTVKSARVVGNTMGVYHPHGDKAIYDTVVNMVMPWNNIIPLIKGEGNFSNVDGDSPAAMRYTEITVLNKIAKYLFSDLNLSDYKPNYDNKTKEPIYLLPKIPFLLFNGTTGIAFTIKTVVPQYAPEEIIGLMVFLINNKFWKYKNYDFELKYKNKLLEIFKGPDSSTGCTIELSKQDVENFLFKKEAKAKFVETFKKFQEIKEEKENNTEESKNIFKGLINDVKDTIKEKTSKKKKTKDEEKEEKDKTNE